jgi:hypothetical protein
MLLYVLWSYFYLKQSFYYHTGPLEVAISGGVAGACFWSSVFPTDVVKSRVQVSVVTVLLITCMLVFSRLCNILGKLKQGQ